MSANNHIKSFAPLAATPRSGAPYVNRYALKRSRNAMSHCELFSDENGRDPKYTAIVSSLYPKKLEQRIFVVSCGKFLRTLLIIILFSNSKLILMPDSGKCT